MNSYRTLGSAKSRPKSMSTISSVKKGSLKTKSTDTTTTTTAFPIKINKRELKIRYEKRTPIYNVAGYHLETGLSNEENYNYFSRLVENKSSTPQPTLASASAGTSLAQKGKSTARSSATILKPIKSVRISNKSNSTENISK